MQGVILVTSENERRTSGATTLHQMIEVRSYNTSGGESATDRGRKGSGIPVITVSYENDEGPMNDPLEKRYDFPR